MDEREPVTTVEELEALDTSEMIEGYTDGRSGATEPGNNRSKAYWHGWRNGVSDAEGTSDAAQRLLAKRIVARA